MMGKVCRRECTQDAQFSKLSYSHPFFKAVHICLSRGNSGTHPFLESYCVCIFGHSLILSAVICYFKKSCVIGFSEVLYIFLRLTLGANHFSWRVLLLFHPFIVSRATFFLYTTPATSSEYVTRLYITVA